jgi:tRNA A-37 threonylcarbamoyl transferase component Bud32
MTPADLEHIRVACANGARRITVVHDTSVGSVLVKWQQPQRPTLRYRMMNIVAGLVGLPLLRASLTQGGAKAQTVEVRRLQSLQSAGLPVPPLLHVDTHFFVLRFIHGRRLDKLLQREDEQALVWWQRGLQCLVDVHAQGQVLSQAFTRNFIAADGQLVLIDFEDDPLEVMSLQQAQARDWLAYLHSTARELAPVHLARTAQLLPALREALAGEQAPVRDLVHRSARRLAWLRHLPVDRARARRGWRRQLLVLKDAVGLALAAADPSGRRADSSEVTHARHH